MIQRIKTDVPVDRNHLLSITHWAVLSNACHTVLDQNCGHDDVHKVQASKMSMRKDHH